MSTYLLLGLLYCVYSVRRDRKHGLRITNPAGFLCVALPVRIFLWPISLLDDIATGTL